MRDASPPIPEGFEWSKVEEEFGAHAEDQWLSTIYVEAWKQYSHEDTVSQQRNQFYVTVQAALIALVAAFAGPLLDLHSEHPATGLRLLGGIIVAISIFVIILCFGWKSVTLAGQRYLKIRWSTARAIECFVGLEMSALAGVEHRWQIFSRKHPKGKYLPYGEKTMPIDARPTSGGWRTTLTLADRLQLFWYIAALHGLALLLSSWHALIWLYCFGLLTVVGYVAWPWSKLMTKHRVLLILGATIAIACASSLSIALTPNRETKVSAAPLASQADTPIGPKWWPSKWGAGDQRGAANLITAEKVAEAGRLIREGKIYQLGRVYEYGMPLPGKRHFSLTIPGVPTAEPEGENMMVSHDEMFSGEIGQIGTQMDGLGHVGVRLPDDDYFYNGFQLSEFGDAYGLKKLGVENIGAFFTRGVLIDVARYKRVERLENGYAISPADLHGALEAQGGKITKGDMVLVRTGHGRLWMKDNEMYGAGEPGLGLAAAKWLTDQDICLVGSDNWAIEVVPHENPKRPFEVHQWTLTRSGVYHLENLDLEQLAADRVYEFAFVFVPVPMRGATGSPGNPIAVR